MDRRNFLKSSGILFIGMISASKLSALSFIAEVADSAKEFKEKIIQIINRLKYEGSNIVKKIMNGKKYEYDPYVHYPYDGGIKDELTGCQLFFHIHRENEFGHFHTFAIDGNGDLIHLVLISMDENGNPIALATVNRWVTGDKFVKADVLKKLSEKFYVEPNLFSDKRIVEFINNIFKAYKSEIAKLFDQRDEWIREYVNKNFNEPFEDREFEILSEVRIDVYS